MTSNHRDLDPRERARRRRERLIIAISVIVVMAITFFESRLWRLEQLIPVSSNILIFGLINVNIILILLLIFLIVRNVVKLIFERRHGIIGSRLRTRLVAAFISLTLIPTALLFVVSVNFLSYSIENWFSMRIGDTLEIYEPGKEIIHPTTNLSLGWTTGKLKGAVRVTDLFGLDAAVAKVVQGQGFATNDIVRSTIK